MENTLRLVYLTTLKTSAKKMSLDLLIMSYALLMAVLVSMSEKLPKFSLRIIIIGLIFSPIAGFISYFYFQRL